MEHPDACRLARPFVILFVAAIVVCAIVPLNAWPFSNWELFSHPRGDRETGWLAVAVDRSGHEHVVSTRALPHGRGHFDAFAVGLGQGSSAARDATCKVWLRSTGATTTSLDVYRLSWLLSDRSGDRAAPPHRTLAWTCTAKVRHGVA